MVRARVQVEQQYTREEAAKLLAVSVDLVDEKIALGRRSPNGLYPVYKFGRLTRIPESAIQRLLESARVR